MAYRKKTLRRLTPEARKLAKLIGEVESVSRRLKSLVPIVERLEVDVRAELKRQAFIKVSSSQTLQSSWSNLTSELTNVRLATVYRDSR